MPTGSSRIPGLAFLLTGIAIGAVSRLLTQRNDPDAAVLKQSLDELETRLARHASDWQQRFEDLESRLTRQERRLGEVPTMPQITALMEDLLGKNMESLVERMDAQAQAVELLKTTVSQTDLLLGRVLESVDSLRRELPAPLVRR